MNLRRWLLALGLLCLPATADAVTVRDIVELTKAGLSDDIIVALIDADRTMFTLDADQILELKRAGVTPVVLLKMVRSRREFETPVDVPIVSEPAAPVAEEQPPQIVVIGAQPPPAPPVEPVFVPYYVPVQIWGTRSHISGTGPRHTPILPPPPAIPHGFGRFINDGTRGRR
jgi:hypothetical protein